MGSPPDLAVVVVLGDIGRSPRMQYQALSLANEGAEVVLVGYPGKAPFTAVTEHSSITVAPLPEPPFGSLTGYSKVFALALAPIKFLILAWSLLAALTWSLPRRPRWILVQNPPSLPTLLVAWIAARLQRASFILDWHNFGYSILGLRYGQHGIIARLAAGYEKLLGSRADGGFTVSGAMKDWLIQHWNIPGSSLSVLHDRPPLHFQSLSIEEQASTWRTLFGLDGADESPSHVSAFREAALALKDEDPLTWTPSETLFTRGSSLRADRPAVVVSSTSWTDDEDFNLLLEGMRAVDRAKATPPVIVVITGVGPNKAAFQAAMAQDTSWTKTRFITPWLEREQYPALLACATVGVCLHTSSSGLDLPMKVVDMFGAGLPVAAVGFPALEELVVDGSNGMVFRDGKELGSILVGLLADFPMGNGARNLARMKVALSEFQDHRWDDEWATQGKPVFFPEKKKKK